MLKQLFKAIIISFMCGSLVMIDFAYKGQSLGVSVNSAYAESVSTGGDDDMTVGVGFSGPITSDLMSTLTMVGISIMASRLFTYGKLTPDIMIAAAGGVAFIAGDMMATSDLKKAKEKIQTEIKRAKNGDMTDEQRMYLIRLIQMYRSSKEAAETKKTMQLAAAAAFAAAAIVAYMGAAAEMTAMTACLSAIPVVTAAETVAVTATCASPPWAQCSAAQLDNAKCNLALSALSASLTAYTTGRTAPSPSCSAVTSINAARAGTRTESSTTPASCLLANSSGTPTALATACEGLYAVHLLNESGCTAPPMLYATTAISVLAMGITAPVLITAIIGFSAGMASTIDTAIHIPTRRAIVWGVLAALSFAASSATSNVISQIEGDIKKLEDLVNNINIQAAGNLGQKAATNKSIKAEIPIYKPINAGADNTTASDLGSNGASLPCLTNPNTTNPSDCKSFSNQVSSFGALDGMPGAVNDNMANISKMGDGLNGTSKVSGGTLSAAGNLANNANALRAALKKVKSEFQNKLDAAGSKLNLNDEENKLRSEMAGAFNNSMAKNKLDQASLTAAYGAGGGFNDINKTAADDLNKLKDKKIGASKFIMPTIGTGLPLNNGMNGIKKSAYDTAIAPDEAALAASKAAASASAAGSIDEYDLKNDINKDKSENIFEVISIRYQKSGYPRLFKKLND